MCGCVHDGPIVSVTYSARKHMPSTTHTHTHAALVPQLDPSDQTVLQHQLCTFLKQSTSAGRLRVCFCVSVI